MIAYMKTSKSGILFAVVFVVILAVIAIFTIRRREESFEGEVIDKDVNQSQMPTNPMNNGANNSTITINNTGMRSTYSIKVKTDAGKVIHYTISEGMYEVVKIGDRVSKPKGTTEISIISKINPTT